MTEELKLNAGFELQVGQIKQFKDRLSKLVKGIFHNVWNFVV